MYRQQQKFFRKNFRQILQLQIIRQPVIMMQMQLHVQLHFHISLYIRHNDKAVHRVWSIGINRLYRQLQYR